MGKNKSWCVAVEIDRLRAELAEAKAALTKYGDQGAFQALRDANARIAELEAAGNRLGDAAVDGVLTSIEAVTELAEWKEQFRVLAILEQQKTAELTITKAQRDMALSTIDTWRKIIYAIETAPKDGRIIDLTWMENGEPQEIWPMQWGHIQRNGLFPGTVGMWVTPCGSLTWNIQGNDGCGPTHWRPCVAC